MEQDAPLSAVEQQRRARLWLLERELLAAAAGVIAGVDEAGRGPLAGPVVVAAVILPVDFWATGLNDSKRMTPVARERVCTEIRTGAVGWALEVVPVEVIDTINILHATYRGMRAVLRALDPAPALALIDGHPLPASPVPQRNVIKGDGRCVSIAAASILAKVHRDGLMLELDAQYPGYGFAHHKGYATPEHYAALQRLGACPAHRRSFAPVQALLQGTLF
ncbi:MAG: ribonuclease HII [Armatimonadota bacterium]